MVHTAEVAARIAEADDWNTPGMCLQQTRTWADIPSRWPTASIAWQNAERRQLNRKGRRGGFAFWTGGSKGFGHIAMILHHGFGDPWIRSTDAGGSGRVATRRLSWFDANWPSLNYVGWTDNVNGFTVPGVMGDWFDMADEADLRRIVREVVVEVIGNRIDNIADETQKAVWARNFTVTNAQGTKVEKNAGELQRDTWQTTKKIAAGK